MTAKPTDDERRLSADALDRVLARASELDAAHRSGVSVAQARQIAAEVGIPEQVFDQALMEIETGAASADVATARPERGSEFSFVKWVDDVMRFSTPGVHPALIPVVGFSLGWLSRLLRPYGEIGGVHYDVLLALLLMLAASAYLLQRHGRRGGQGGFQRDLFALWAANMGGWALLNGGFWSDMTFVFSAYWVGTAMVGGVIIEWLRQRTRHSAPKDSTVPTTA